MASHTLRSDRFPVGQSVGAYLRAQRVPDAAPTGSPVATATVATDGTLAFTGLLDGTRYSAYASVSSTHRYVDFMTNASTTDQESTAEILTMEDRWPRGALLFDDSFSDGYCGWTDHMSGSTQQGVLSLTGYPSVDGAALKLSTGAKRSTVADCNCTAIKRMSRIQETGRLHFEVWMAIGAEQLSVQPQQVDLGVDTELWNSAQSVESRGFPKLRYRKYDGTSQALIDRWALLGDGTGDTSGTFVAGSNIDIPGSDTGATKSIIGINENKQNLFYVRLTMDLARVCAYVEVQIGPNVFDLSALGAGRGRVLPQAISGGDSFAGGMNFYLAISNRNQTDVGRCWVVVDRARAWVTP